MHFSWLCESTGSCNSLTGHSIATRLTSAISDLGLFAVSRGFLAIPMLLGLLSRYYAFEVSAVQGFLRAFTALSFMPVLLQSSVTPVQFLTLACS